MIEQTCKELIKEIIEASHRMPRGKKKLIHFRYDLKNKSVPADTEKALIEICNSAGFNVEKFGGCKLLTKI